MKSLVYKIIILGTVALLHVSNGHVVQAQSLIPSLGTARSGTAGFQFTKIIVDPRSAAMGSSNMATAADGSSWYWNPALGVQAPKSEIMFGHTSYFADISMEYVSVLYRHKEFAFGGSLQFLDSGDITETTEFDPFGTGRTFKTTHAAIGLSASQQLTESFSYGLTLKFLMEKIEEVDVNTAAIDFGFFYSVGETGLKFSVGISNFGFDANPSGSTFRESPSGGVIEEDEFENVELPTRFVIASAYEAVRGNTHTLTLTGQITNPSDNSEQLSIGGEYGFVNQFFVRAGYQFGTDEIEFPSLGAGVRMPFGQRNIFADYSYNTFDRLGDVHRISLRITF